MHICHFISNAKNIHKSKKCLFDTNPLNLAGMKFETKKFYGTNIVTLHGLFPSSNESKQSRGKCN